MAFLSKYSPLPGFPDYNGPYTVGSSDFEVPVSSLTSVAPTPDDEVTTIQYRIFYPCDAKGREPYVRWLNSPQRANVQAFASFMGAGNIFAHLFSYFPHLFYLANIPARRNAAPVDPNATSAKWPVVIFSHGLAGSRNSYSEICGSLASYGMVVVAPEHRDGSAPISFQRTDGSTKLRPTYYRRASHRPSPETYAHRDNQLKIRLWELGLVYDAVSRMHSGTLPLSASFCDTAREHAEILEVLQSLEGRLNIEPGKVVFAGHSFGGATTLQFLKSVYYTQQGREESDYSPLYSPNAQSELVRQVTPHSPTILLDMWCLPLRSPATEWLWRQPLPCYATGGPGGSAVLCVLSDTFVKWKENLLDNKLSCSEDPQDDSLLSSAASPQPYFFYPKSSAHLNQSDFGMLFPNVTRLAFKTGDPQISLDLNVRAILQVLRECGHEIAPTSNAGLAEYDGDEPSTDGTKIAIEGGKGDWRILAKDGGVKHWKYISLRSETVSDSETSDSAAGSDVGDATSKWQDPQDAVVEGEVLGEVRVHT